MCMQDISIGNYTLGLGKKVFISAEVGTTCNGDVETAKKLIDVGKAAGVDAVKFQLVRPSALYSEKNIPYVYKRHDGVEVTENIYEMTKMYEFDFEQWSQIKHYGDEKDIIVFATPAHEDAVDWMEKLNTPVYKISTWDSTCLPFVQKIARLGKPTIIDLGASDTEQVARMLKVFEQEGNTQLVLLHCYHTREYDQMNLRTIEYLREAFGYLSGFSAADANNDIDFLSLAYGAVYIEKRMTLDRKDPHHHHARAVEPDEMKAYVQRIHELSAARGQYTVRPSEGDLKSGKKYFRRIVARQDIRAGDLLTKENIAYRRPHYGGLDTKYYECILGRRAVVDMVENEPITWDKV